jgi:hypothetical protein
MKPPSLARPQPLPVRQPGLQTPHKVEGRHYQLHSSPPSLASLRQRIVPPRRPANLRRGGGRRDKPGWTEQKRKTNRRRFDQLRPLIITGVTVTCPPRAAPEQLKAIGDCCRNFCKEKGIPARAVWEGPCPHFHIALACHFSAKLDRKWRARLKLRWQAVFERAMPSRAFLWKPDAAGQKIASYLSKTCDKQGRPVKGQSAWLKFSPAWETGFRSLIQGQASPSPACLPATPDTESPCFSALYLQNASFCPPAHGSESPHLPPCQP